MTSASLPVHMTTGDHYLIYSLLSLAKSKRVCLDPGCRLRLTSCCYSKRVCLQSTTVTASLLLDHQLATTQPGNNTTTNHTTTNHTTRQPRNHATRQPRNQATTQVVKEATEAQARFWQQQSLSTEYRKRHRYHKVGEEAFTALQRNGEVPEGIPRDRVWVAWCRSHELNKRYSFKAICKRLGRDPVTGKMAVKRNAQVPTEEEDGDGEEQECYSSDQEEEDDDYNLAPEEDSSSRPHQDPSLKWELSSRIPVILEGDLIPPPKPPILSDAENWGLALDLSQIKDTEDDSEGEGNTSTEETRQQKPDAKPHHDVVRFLSAWKTILMLLSPVAFERMRGVCKGLLDLVKCLERTFWCKLRYNFCNPRDRQHYMREKANAPAVRAIEMAINCSPFCLETVHELEVYGGFIAKRFDIHCTTGQKPTPATL
ncbi:hypothetical protein Pelo_9082 [Pelomyxa schiedti]|nr:hypothetical protein Pelo_9082 [Pelomyxa schiedti]